MEPAIKSSVRLSSALLFDALFPLMVLTAFAAGGIFPVHFAALIYSVVISVLAFLVKNIRQAGILLIVSGTVLSLLISGWSVLPVIALAAYFFWRLLVRTNHRDAHEITTIQLILFLVVFISVYSFQLTYEIYPKDILIISFIAGFVLYSSSPYFSSYAGRKALKLYGKWSGIFLVGGVIIYMLISPVKTLFLAGGSQLMTWITLLFSWTEFDIEIHEIELEKEEGEGAAEGRINSPNPYEAEIEETISIGTLELIVVIAGVLILSFLVWKAVRKFSGKGQLKQKYQSGMTITTHEIDQPVSFKEAVPSHIVRKEMLKLEKKAAMKNAGRLKSETVREWFSRLNIQQAGTLAAIYEKIRYADADITESELRAFEQFVKDFEKRIKSF